MTESRWRQRAGPGVLALGLVALLGAPPAGAADEAWSPPPCDPVQQTVARPPSVEPAAATWYRLDARLDDRGSLVGQRLVTGRGDGPSRNLDLSAESFAAGPFGDRVLAGSDDGRRSELRLVDVVAGCASAVATERDVIRRATLTMDATTVYEFRVGRHDRADLGVWRRPVDGSTAPERVLPPIAPDRRFGPTFLTELSWSLDGTRLVVQSCGQSACRIRVLDATTGHVVTIDDPDLGDAIGLAGEWLVAYRACRGLPCPIESIELASGARTVVTDGAGFAAVVATRDGPRIAFEDEARPAAGIRIADITGRDRGRIDGAPGLRLVPSPMRAGAAVGAPTGWLVLAPDGRPSSGSRRTVELAGGSR